MQVDGGGGVGVCLDKWVCMRVGVCVCVPCQHVHELAACMPCAWLCAIHVCVCVCVCV